MSFSPKSSIINRTIDLQYADKKRSNSLKWLAINIVLMLLFLYDLSRKCAGYTSALHWVEMCCAGVLGANAVQHAVCVVRCRRALPVQSPRQQRLMDVSGAPTTPVTAAPASLSPARSWRAADASPPPSPPSPSLPPATPLAADEFISDHHSLANYLRQQGARAREEAGAGSVGGAWSPLRGAAPPAHYQLASLDSEWSALEERGAAAGAGAAPTVWRRLLLEPARLTEWNQNLRLWLHVTILQRLVREMARVDEALGEARLGHVGVERLQKLPAAAALLPYLEPFADQRYAVQRVRELAHGGCLSAYRWSGGGSDWDEAKPTDAELLLRLLAAYLDAQLPPSPAARPFSAVHLSAIPDAPPRGPGALAVHRARLRPPHYVLALGDETVEVARGRNNLLHTLLLFIAAAARAEPPTLQRLHLGPAGLNMLWIIGR